MIALFLDAFEDYTDERARVVTRHYVPEMLSEEQLEQAILVEELPEPTPRKGYTPHLYCNPQTKELWYEYEAVKPSEEERLEALEFAVLSLMFVGGGASE